MTQETKPPRNLRELVDQEREKLATDAQELMYVVPNTTEFVLQVGAYRGVKEFLDRIDEMVKRAKNEED